MASISKQKNGRRTVQFVAADGKRKSIRLGKVSQNDALTVKLKIEKLVAATITKHGLDAETARWVKGLETGLAEKLANAGLIEPPDASTLQAFINAYIESRTDVKPSTATKYRNARKNLIDFFGAEKRLRDVTEADAGDFRRYLASLEYSENTIRLRCRGAKQFFRSAVKRRLIDSNPFEELKGLVSSSNPSRQYFVSREDAGKILQSCPDAQWRLIFALSRFGGLRCPSEHLALRWDDILWDEEKMIVSSPKTEHHEGKESRVIPIFPEIRPYLDEVWELAEDDAEYVITRYRDPKQNLRTTFEKIIKRAGLKAWPKLFHNLRSTRETELAEQFPMHTVCSWIGNSQLIAAKHYLQVTDEHFERALQNPVQYPVVSGETGQEPIFPAHKNTPDLQGCSTKYQSVRRQSMRLRGVEPPRP